MCCCRVGAERAVYAPGGAPCALRSLAHRLRRIGDELEKRWTTGAENHDDNNNHGADNGSAKGGVSVKDMHLLCTAIQVTVLLLFVGWRHL